MSQPPRSATEVSAGERFARALASKDRATLRALLTDPAITMEDVAKRLQVSPAPLYRYFPGGQEHYRQVLSDGECSAYSQSSEHARHGLRRQFRQVQHTQGHPEFPVNFLHMRRDFPGIAARTIRADDQGNHVI